jgi:hypothetical protein
METRTTLQLHTGTWRGACGGSKESATAARPRYRRGEGNPLGISRRNVEYVALDPAKQKIPLIEVRDASGKVKATYFSDATAGIMPCRRPYKMPRRGVRLHRLPQFHGPSVHAIRRTSSTARIEEGRIDRGLPSIKARSDAITPEGERESPDLKRSARRKFAELIAASAPQGEQDPKAKAAEQKLPRR